MKRNMDLIRELLLRLESLPMRTGEVMLFSPGDKEIAIPGYSDDKITYHLSLLREGGLIECPGSQPLDGSVTFRSLTWHGHDLLDAVRGATCPDACPLKANGCYADGGPLGKSSRMRIMICVTRGADASQGLERTSP
jgi:Hypothetical protein (DUF2513)